MKDDPAARRARFVWEYVACLSATQAAICAGYSPWTAKQQRSRLLTKADVAAAVWQGLEARTAERNRAELTAAAPQAGREKSKIDEIFSER